MPDDQGTLNTDVAAAPSTAGQASLVGEFFDTMGTKPISSVTDTAKSGSEDDAKSKAGDDGPSATDTKGQDGTKQKTRDTDDGGGSHGAKGRLDHDERFQDVIKQNRDLKNELANLRGMIEGMSKGSAGESDGAKGLSAKDFKDVSKMSKDEILEMMDEHPDQFYANMMATMEDRASALVNNLVETKLTASQQKQQEEAIALTFDKYSDENPDFDDLWDKGDIQKYMRQNPGHNAISAHMAMTMQERVDQAVKDARKNERSKVYAELKAGQGASGLSTSSGTGMRPSDEAVDDDMLKNPQKYGGTEKVLFERYKRRQAAG